MSLLLCPCEVEADLVSRQRVLIIDEDRRTVDRLQEKFVQSGFEAEIALSGAVGVAIAAERHMSVAILSAKIGQEESWSIVRQLRQSDPQLPVVLFNAPKVKGLSKEARRAGVAKFIQIDVDAHLVYVEATKLMRN